MCVLAHSLVYRVLHGGLVIFGILAVPPMKVFWSWQSDTPGKVGRHFVRDALDDAIQALRQPGEIEDANRPEGLKDLHLDHDNKGLLGSPDLAPAILKKIREASAFVADVTLVGEVRKDVAPTNKQLINSNVAIEYGYAAGVLTDERILMVQNTYYGDRSGLPFDLAGKVGPLQFSLAPDAAAGQRASVRRELIANLKDRLKDILVLATTNGVPVTPFARRPSVSGPAFFFRPAEGLGSYSPREGLIPPIDVTFTASTAAYMRLIPTAELPAPLDTTGIHNLVSAHKLALLDHNAMGGLAVRNRYGSMFFEVSGSESPEVRALAQLFRNGEMWTVSSSFFIRDGGSREVLDLGPLRNGLARAIHSFHQVYLKELGGSSPVEIEMGVVGLENVYCHEGNNQYRGPFLLPQVIDHFTLSPADGEDTIDLGVNNFVSLTAREAGPVDQSLR